MHAMSTPCKRWAAWCAPGFEILADRLCECDACVSQEDHCKANLHCDAAAHSTQIWTASSFVYWIVMQINAENGAGAVLAHNLHARDRVCKNSVPKLRQLLCSNSDEREGGTWQVLVCIVDFLYHWHKAKGSIAIWWLHDNIYYKCILTSSL